MRAAIFLTLLTVSGFAVAAKKEPPQCVSLSAAVENGQKKLSAAEVDDFFGSNPSKETLRQAKAANALSEIQANLARMQAQKCAQPAEEISAKWYTNAALQCEIALSKAQRTGQKGMPSECDRDQWVRATK